MVKPWMAWKNPPLSRHRFLVHAKDLTAIFSSLVKKKFIWCRINWKSEKKVQKSTRHEYLLQPAGSRIKFRLPLWTLPEAHLFHIAEIYGGFKEGP